MSAARAASPVVVQEWGLAGREPGPIPEWQRDDPPHQA